MSMGHVEPWLCLGKVVVQRGSLEHSRQLGDCCGELILGRRAAGCLQAVSIPVSTPHQCPCRAPEPCAVLTWPQQQPLPCAWQWGGPLGTAAACWPPWLPAGTGFLPWRLQLNQFLGHLQRCRSQRLCSCVAPQATLGVSLFHSALPIPRAAPAVLYKPWPRSPGAVLPLATLLSTSLIGNISQWGVSTGDCPGLARQKQCSTMLG